MRPVAAPPEVSTVQATNIQTLVLRSPSASSTVSVAVAPPVAEKLKRHDSVPSVSNQTFHFVFEKT